MIVALTLLIWAGVHNARERRLAMQKADEMRASQAVLVPDHGGSGGAEAPATKLEGKPAPGFTLIDLDGKKVSLADFRGKPVLIDFWATWCGPCKLEMPWIAEFSQKYAGQGLVVLGLVTDSPGNETIRKTASRSGVSYPVLMADDKVEDAYGGVDYLPENFYVDRSGKVAIETFGVTSESGGKDEMEANIKKVIAQ